MDDADGERDYQLKWLQEQVGLQRGTIEYLQDLVAGLQYELHVRDIRIEELRKENDTLRKRLEEQAPPPPPATGPSPPPWVKPDVAPHRRKKPGRKAGHEPALRPPPLRVDVTLKVPLPRDKRGRRVCPRCRGVLKKLKRHRRLVEDIVPARVRVTCYATRSGYCPCCKKRVESRHREQPPAADLPHAQLGLNALATAALLRVENRLPFRQVRQLLADLPRLHVSAGTLARQLQRMAGWLDGEHACLRTRLRGEAAVNADETGWRQDGSNAWLWTLTGPRHTLYHVDPSRGGRVVRGLLGEAFGGTLGCDFYGAYDAMRCPKQRCLTHLLRELKETARDQPAFAAGGFHRRCKRLCRDLLKLKRQWDQLGDAAYTTKACRLEDRLEQLGRAHAADPEPHARRLARRLLRYQKELTAFLWDRQVDGTNNAAERALRPAVVFRKITGGSRGRRGARAWAVLASILRTARQQGRDVLATLKTLLIKSWAGQEPGLLTC